MKPSQYSTDNIRSAVLTLFGTGYGDLCCSARSPHLVLARTSLVGCLRHFTRCSYPEIAPVLGRKCHSFAHNAQTRWNKLKEIVLPNGKRYTKKEFLAEISFMIERKVAVELLPDPVDTQADWPLYPTGKIELLWIWQRCDAHGVGWVKNWKRPAYNDSPKGLVEI